MPANEATFTSSPLILDVDMPTESLDELDFGLFSSTTSHATGLSPGSLFDRDLTTEDYPDLAVLGTPDPIQSKQDSAPQAHFHGARSQPQSSGSPSGSYQDSSSDSSGSKRKSSSESSRSAFTNKDIMMSDAEMNDWKVDSIIAHSEDDLFGRFDGTVDPSAMHGTFHFNDKSMENDFDFESATSSPSPFGTSGDLGSPEMPTIKHDNTAEPSRELRPSFGHNKGSRHTTTPSVHTLKNSVSREVSPLSTMLTSQESSPGVFSGSSSNHGGVEFIGGPMLTSAAQNPTWPPNYDFVTPSRYVKGGLTPPSMSNNIPSPLSSSTLDSAGAHTLFIHSTPLKSRVETQIPIRLSLWPIPAGVTKLHLPTHTISKPKLLAKPDPERSPDTLELSTMLVCTSAMQNKDLRLRAFKRAAAGSQTTSTSSESTSDGSADESEEDKPLNGGEVRICEGCIIRERKRAARKKVKKVEEEDSWHKDERKRVIVFNTQEVKEWQPVNLQTQTEDGTDRLDPYIPESAMQIDIPMRIACYCRHQNEKVGFQVIFTIKDHNNRVIAQGLTSSIMITDDHKTHNIPPAMSNASDGMFPNSGLFPPETGFDMLGSQFRMSHSSSDLQNMQRNYSLSYQHPMTSGPTAQASTTTSSTLTPRNLSRQASPTDSIGPTSKKRKASGSSKVPTGLAMTKLDTNPGLIGQSSGSSSLPPASTPSPYTPSINFQSLQETAFGQVTSSIQALPPGYTAGPPTPNSNDQGFFSNVNRSHSLDNLGLHQIISAPTSAHPSRAPSPSGYRNGGQVFQPLPQQPAQLAQPISNSIYSIPLSLNPHRPPTIHKLIPSEGPKAGGIEVTCLGSGFCQGLEVMFGDVQATTTTYWGETSIVCLLPPSAFAGTVPVTFKHQHTQQLQSFPAPIPKQQAFFKYIDDDEQQIIRTALAVLGHKMTGRMEDVRDLARRIVGDGPSAWGSSTGHSPSSGTQHQHVAGFNAATFGVDVEVTLLRCLDLIDLDDSPNMPRLNLRRASGQTMLHLACALGLHRFVAALLARGANPEPRDKSGFTPMHFAAMHNHPQIVRRLILGGADPTIRTLQGYTPSDLSTSEDVLRAIRRIEHHTRSRSGGSLRSRNSSATSLRSLWEPSMTGATSAKLASADQDLSDSSDDDGDHEGEYEQEDADAAADDIFWMQSRRRSTQEPVIEAPPRDDPALDIPVIATAGGRVSPSAAMIAFRDQLSAQIQHLQHTMHANLPNLPQMPTLPMIPNLPDYQAYLPTSPMVRRISSLVPHMGSTSRNGSPSHTPKDTDYKWWDLFSGSLPPAPPAYEDIFPQDGPATEKSSIVQAQSGTTSDGKSTVVRESTEVITTSSQSPSKTMLENLRIGPRITREQQEQLRLAHAAKMKKLRSDRNLFFIWIPLLIVIIVAMLYNRLPDSWAPGYVPFKSVTDRVGRRITAIR